MNTYIDDINNLIIKYKDVIKIDIDNNEEGIIHINRLDAKVPGNGYGSKFMTDLLNITDKNNILVTLIVDETYNPENLYKFYTKNGFMQYTKNELRMVHASHITSEMILDIHNLIKLSQKSDKIKDIYFNNEIKELTLIMDEHANLNDSFKIFLQSLSEKHKIDISYEQKQSKNMLDELRTGERYKQNKIIEYFYFNHLDDVNQFRQKTF